MIQLMYHYSVVEKLLASGAEVPLAARVRIPIGAEVGVTPNYLKIIFMSFSTIKTEK